MKGRTRSHRTPEPHIRAAPLHQMRPAARSHARAERAAESNVWSSLKTSGFNSADHDAFFSLMLFLNAASVKPVVESSSFFSTRVILGAARLLSGRKGRAERVGACSPVVVARAF